jgi:UDP-2,4-diacetamido-2,4,6-trideoxy-beta-L-altropyranose hydrolase
MGSGHIMRCATLGGWLRQRGAEVTFICRELDGNYCDWLEAQGYSVLRLRKPLATDVPDHRLAHAHWLGVTQATDSVDVRHALAGRFYDWLIVDHYALDAEWERELRTIASRVMVIDDLADRRHDADLLLDQNLQLHPNRYQGLVPDPCTLLLGPDYALLRPEFAHRRATTQTRTGEIKRLLVFMGGSDPLNLTARVLRAIAEARLLDVRTDVVLGAGSPHEAEVRKIAAAITGCSIHIQTNAMATLMTEADLMIGAPGSSTWERCCLGLPSVLIGFAANQLELGRQIASRKAAIFLGEADAIEQRNLPRILRKLATKPELLQRMSQRATRVTDGSGGTRVSAELFASGMQRNG